MAEPNKPQSKPRRGLAPSAPKADAQAPFPIVGIGASAGGLEALSELFRNLPADTGMAFVVISHLDPAHASDLTNILAKLAAMPVLEIRVGMAVRPNHIYVIAPNSEITIEDGKLRTTKRSLDRGPHLPIDIFLRSLAEERQSRAVGVVLSGTGTDGTLGLGAIKGVGGLTFAQDETAGHAGMPRSAIASGSVDAVLSPAGIAQELVRVGGHPYLVAADGLEDPAAPPSWPAAEDATFTAIVKLLSGNSGVNFSQYKHPTLRRRIERRMVLRRAASQEEYLKCLRDDPSEVKSLFEEALIQVTSFFRDPEAFELLTRVVFPALIEGRQPDAPLRIWVPGCATGEEVYSLAICLLEFLGDRATTIPIKIFATDIASAAIDTARSGIYLESIAAQVSESRLRRFFVRNDGNYQINKAVRDLCIFARHDVTRDPPFSSLDLVSCRNVLIYLGPALQARVLPVFHYALKSAGFLMLGSSETVGPFAELFKLVDKTYKLYRRLAGSSRLNFDYVSGDRSVAGATLVDPTHPFISSVNDVQREADRVVLSRFAPSGVVVDERFGVVQFRGHTGNYLEPPPGSPSHDVLAMAREGLLTALQGALEEAKGKGCPARRANVRVKGDGDPRQIDLEVIPITEHHGGRRFYIVLFHEAQSREATAEPAPPAPAPAAEEAGPYERERLQQELAATRAYLQSVIEQQETSNEELRAANEEIVSSNEELQSTNEELETAKEELQATNEELRTVNDELENRIQVATQLSDDLANLIDAVNIPTVVLDHDLRVRRFSPSARRVMNLIAGDIGRRIGDIRSNLELPNLEPLVSDVLDSLSYREQEVVDHEGRYFKLQLRPYRTLDQRIDGIVLTFLDIDALKKNERLIQQSRDRAVAIVETVRNPLVILDGELRIRRANVAFYRTFKVTTAETEGKLIFNLGGSSWDIPRLRELLERIVESDTYFEDFEVAHAFPKIGPRTLLLNARRLVQDAGETSPLVLLAIEDVSDRRRVEEVVRSSEARIRALVDNAAEGIITIDEGGIIESYNKAAVEIFGYPPEEVLGKEFTLLLPAADVAGHRAALAEHLLSGASPVSGDRREILGRRRDGTTFPMLLGLSEDRVEGRRKFTGIVRDISALREAQQRALQAERLAAIGEAMAGLTHESRNALQRSQSCLEMLGTRVAHDAESLQLVERLQSAQDHLHRLYEHVREYARPVVGRVEPCHLAEIVGQAWELLAAGRDRHATRFEQEPTNLDLRCQGDREALEQVFRNVLENAIDAGAEAIKASYRESEQEGEAAIQVSLRNDGPELTADEKQRIFEPFFSTKTKGTGLGMAIARRIVEAYGGRIAVGDGAQPGTEIVVTLPRGKP